MVARSGDPSPLIASTWDTLDQPEVNNAGAVAFRARLSGSNLIKDGVFIDDGSGALPVALANDPAVGLTPTNVFGSFGAEVAINDAGRTAFLGITTVPAANGGRTGIWSDGRTGGLELVAFENDIAPGTGGMTFIGFPEFEVSRLGLVAFQASLFDADTGNHPDGVFAQSPDGAVHLIAHEGELFEVLPGSFAVIEEVAFNNDFFNPLPQHFDDDMALVFRARFDDGRTGVYTVKVPEPTSARLVLIGTVAYGLARRRYAPR
jgi:hypothetical protein